MNESSAMTGRMPLMAGMGALLALLLLGFGTYRLVASIRLTRAVEKLRNQGDLPTLEDMRDQVHHETALAAGRKVLGVIALIEESDVHRAAGEGVLREYYLQGLPTDEGDEAAQHDALVAYRVALRPTLEQLSMALAAPEIRYSNDWIDRCEAEEGKWRAIASACRALTIAYWAACVEEDYQGAADYCHDQLALAYSLRHEYALWAAEECIDIEGAAIGGVQGLAYAGALEIADRRKFAASIERAAAYCPIGRGVTGYVATLYEMAYNDRVMASIPWDSRAWRSHHRIEQFIGRGQLSYSQILQSYAEILAAIRKARTERAMLPATAKGEGDPDLFVSEHFNAEQLYRSVARLALLRTAQYALAPDQPAPMDPYSGEPLRLVQADGVVQAISVGADREFGGKDLRSVARALGEEGSSD